MRPEWNSKNLSTVDMIKLVRNRIAPRLPDNIELEIEMHYACGGIAFLAPVERKSAEELGERTVNLAYGTLRKTWHPDSSKWPTVIGHLEWFVWL